MRIIIFLALLVFSVDVLASRMSKAKKHSEKKEEVVVIEKIRQGMAHLVLIQEEDVYSRNAILNTSNGICGRQSICIVMYWGNKLSYPKSLPMTESQLKAKVAHFNFNKNTEFRNLQICSLDGC